MAIRKIVPGSIELILKNYVRVDGYRGNVKKIFCERVRRSRGKRRSKSIEDRMYVIEEGKREGVGVMS